MPARGQHNENHTQKQSFISDGIHSSSTSPTPFATLDHPPALSAFNSPAMVTHHLSDAEVEDMKETGGKVQEDLEFSVPVPPQPPSLQPSTPSLHDPGVSTPATNTGHIRAPVLARWVSLLQI